jgi:nitroreductase
MIGQAPVLIAAVALDPAYKMPCGVHSHTVDLGIAVEHMVLAAVDEGLGACWVGAFSQEKVKEVLQIPGKYVVVGVLPIGYANQQRAASSRKSFEEIVCYEIFKE